MVAARLATGPLLGPLPPEALARWGLSLDALAAGGLHRIATSTFLSHDGGMFLRQVAFAALVAGTHEWREGTGRTVGAFALGDVAGSTLVLLAVVAPLAAWPGGAFADLAGTLDVGMSAGGFALLGSILAGTARPRTLAAVAALGIAAKLALAPDILADGAHLIALATGWSLRTAIGPRGPREPQARPASTPRL